MLEVLAEASGKGLPLTEIGQRSGLAYSTTYRILETLRRRKFVYQAQETGVYSIGLRAFQVGMAFSAQYQWFSIANSAMAALVEAVNETCSLAILEGREAINLHQIQGDRMMRLYINSGSRLPLHATAAGKALIAWLDQEKAAELLTSSPLPALTCKTLTGKAELLAELERVRQQGYAVDDEEHELGVRCVSAPVWDQRGRVVAAVSVASPATRLPTSELESMSEHLIAAAKVIASNLE